MILRFKLLWLLVFGIGLLVLVCGWGGYCVFFGRNVLLDGCLLACCLL